MGWNKKAKSNWPVERLQVFSSQDSELNRRRSNYASQQNLKRLSAGLYAAVAAVSLAAMFAFIGLKPVLYLATKGRDKQNTLPVITKLIETCDYTYPGCYPTYKYPKILDLKSIDKLAKANNISPRLLLALASVAHTAADSSLLSMSDLEKTASIYKTIKTNNSQLPSIPPIYVNRHGSYKLTNVNEENYQIILVLTHTISDTGLYNRLLVSYQGEETYFITHLNQYNP